MLSPGKDDGGSSQAHHRPTSPTAPGETNTFANCTNAAERAERRGVIERDTVYRSIAHVYGRRQKPPSVDNVDCARGARETADPDQVEEQAEDTNKEPVNLPGPSSAGGDCGGGETQSSPPELPELRRSTRQRRPPDRY
ncbi:hypothetical protein HPB51_014216 [Rhipicephalus microplus]|uniref:Uncharacterized protein n=1 Tax=Rhipicephalus microplus TaxID=6941 RepID=A0A9J6E296_RHIMP|nr:hypothetical protein HPB51_014216 [Rhipicephalus microplus]